MKINKSAPRYINPHFCLKLYSLIFYQKSMNTWLILLILLLSFQCQNESNINIRTINIVSEPTYKDIKILTKNGDELYRKTNPGHPNSRDSFLTNLLIKSNLTNLRDDIMLRMNYYGIEDLSQNNQPIHDVDSLLKHLNTRKFIDFRTPDGQILSKIIISMEFGNTDSITNYGIKLYTSPRANFSQGDETLSNILLDSLGLKATQGLFSMDNLTELIRDGILIDQLSGLVNQNGTLLLILIDISNEKSIRKLAYLYYQYIDPKSGFLKISKICVNPFRYYPKYYE